MCCMWTVLLFLGPRAAVIVWWLVNPARVMLATGGNFILPLVGVIFLPFTTLMYIILAPVGGLQLYDWLWLAIGVLLDLSTYGGGAYTNRERLQPQ